MAETRVLITGGTRGVGLATGLAFARSGAEVVLTHRWGSVAEADVHAQFAAIGAAKPTIIEADVAFEEDTHSLLSQLGGPVDVFVSNVCVAARGDGNFKARTLAQSLEYSTWPLQRYTSAMLKAWNALPRYVLAMSSDGHRAFYPGYDWVAASKALLEQTTESLARQYRETSWFCLRARQANTQSYREMFSDDARELISQFSRFDLNLDALGEAAVAVCEGHFDAMSGKTLVLDRGAGWLDRLVNVGPKLLGQTAAWEGRSWRGGRSSGMLYVDAGLPPGELEPSRVVSLKELPSLPAAEIPEAVVVGIDWQSHDPDSTKLAPAATALVETLQRAEDADGKTPRYGIQMEHGDSPQAELSATLGRYWSQWRCLADTRVNFVRAADVGSAQRVCQALLGGRFDDMDGQILAVGIS